MTQIMTVTQECDVSVAYYDANNQPAQVDGIPVWSVSDDSVLALTVADDGMSGVVSSKGVVGVSQLSISADADMGQGVRSLVSLADFEIVANEAVTANVSIGAPREIVPQINPLPATP